ncbi:MAG: hypothetical protein D3923_08715 [Candidatus Electrothrix sp. AR3]|nr:hypothetical protein [Candidatus Electrothrix sp. AR3]
MNAISDYTVPYQVVQAPQQQPKKGSIALTPEKVGELESYINDLHINNGSLTAIGELLQGYDGSKKIDFYCVGILVGHHAGVITDSLEIIEEFVYANKSKHDEINFEA